jgi:hypothetical protein
VQARTGVIRPRKGEAVFLRDLYFLFKLWGQRCAGERERGECSPAGSNKPTNNNPTKKKKDQHLHHSGTTTPKIPPAANYLAESSAAATNHQPSPEKVNGNCTCLLEGPTGFRSNCSYIPDFLASFLHIQHHLDLPSPTTSPETINNKHQQQATTATAINDASTTDHTGTQTRTSFLHKNKLDQPTPQRLYQPATTSDNSFNTTHLHITSHVHTTWLVGDTT